MMKYYESVEAEMKAAKEVSEGKGNKYPSLFRKD